MNPFGQMFDFDRDGSLSFFESVSAHAFTASLLDEESTSFSDGSSRLWDDEDDDAEEDE